MGYRNYTETERRRMAEIYVACGGNGSAIPGALARIRDEMGIVLPRDGRSLRNWQKEYGIYPKKETQASLFTGYQDEGKVIVLPRLMPFEEFQVRMQCYAGEDQDKDRQLLNALYAELGSNRIAEALKTKGPDELLKIKQMIEDAQQKRELHLVKMTEFVDYLSRNAEPDKNKLDDKILQKIERVG